MRMKTSFGLFACLVLSTTTSAGAQTVHPELARLFGSPMPGNPVEWAYSRFAAGETPIVILPAHDGDYVQFPFGYGEARVECARLQACPIELQPGERLLDEPLTGDTERWIIETSASGPNGEVPLVIVKPTDCDLSTNVLIPTDRRVYMLSLFSGRCEKRGTTWSTAQRTKFWYPDEMRHAQHEIREAERELDRMALAPCEGGSSINHDYEIKQRGGSWFRRDQPFAWIPEKVCDDGIRTFIQLPEGARHAEMPVLYQIGEDGQKELLNYTPRGDVIITDRVLFQGALIVNSGGKERRVDITNRGRFPDDEGERDVRN